MRIYIVSAYPTVRAGLRALVREHAGWEVAGEASPALPQADSADPIPPGATGSRGRDESGRDDQRVEDVDVLLADLDAASGADQLTTLLQVIQPRAGVVAIGAASARPDGPDAASPFVPSFLPTTLSATLGLGLLPRDATAEEIISAIEAVARGLIVLDRGMARRLLNSARVPTGASGANAREMSPLLSEPLTAREHEVLQLLAEGLPNKLIAARLHVSEHTAKFHVASIMTKLGAASRTEAVTLAARRGLLIL